jgi:membrane protease FtsH catalytic subunit (EC 3.4.24.-)
VNEAALFAARENAREVRMSHLDKARDKILMGSERRSMAMSEDEKKLTAYHEAGHAIVGRLVPEHDPVYKVTIIPRGRALGVTMYLPEGDKYSINRTGIESRLATLYGGRVAEELIFGSDKVTTGPPTTSSGHQDGPQHGHQVGPVGRAGSDHLRRGGGRGVPRPFGFPAQERVRRHRAQDR